MNIENLKSKIKNLQTNLSIFEISTESGVRFEEDYVSFLQKTLAGLKNFITKVKETRTNVIKNHRRSKSQFAYLSARSNSPGGMEDRLRYIEIKKEFVKGKSPTFGNIMQGLPGNKSPDLRSIVEKPQDFKNIYSSNEGFKDLVMARSEDIEVTSAKSGCSPKITDRKYKRRKAGRNRRRLKLSKKKESNTTNTSINAGSVEKMMKKVQRYGKNSERTRGEEKSQSAMNFYRNLRAKSTNRGGEKRTGSGKLQSRKPLRYNSTFDNHLPRTYGKIPKKKDEQERSTLSLYKKVKFERSENPKKPGVFVGKINLKKSFDIQKFKQGLIADGSNASARDTQEGSKTQGKVSSYLEQGKSFDNGKILMMDLNKPGRNSLEKLELRKLKLNLISEELDKLDKTLSETVFGEGD